MYVNNMQHSSDRTYLKKMWIKYTNLNIQNTIKPFTPT